jgi:hypothetical protein
MDPNPYAQNRVSSLSKNPCLSGKYYLNAVFKETKTVQSETAAANYATVKEFHECSYNNYFFDAFIIYPSFWSKDKIEHLSGF